MQRKQSPSSKTHVRLVPLAELQARAGSCLDQTAEPAIPHNNTHDDKRAARAQHDEREQRRAAPRRSRPPARAQSHLDNKAKAKTKPTYLIELACAASLTWSDAGTAILQRGYCVGMFTNTPCMYEHAPALTPPAAPRCCVQRPAPQRFDKAERCSGELGDPNVSVARATSRLDMPERVGCPTSLRAFRTTPESLISSQSAQADKSTLFIFLLVVLGRAR
jgi:hypothetical protein